MVIYFSVFTVATIFFALSEKFYKHKYIFAAVSIIILCAFAALRDVTIGTDVLVYMKPIYNQAIYSNSIFDFFSSYYMHSYNLKQILEIESGFTLLAFFTAKIFNSFEVFLFFIQFLIVTPIYMAMLKISKQTSVWLSMLMFLLFFYNTSFNLARQFIAISFIIYGLTYMFENKYSIAAALYLVSILFHYSAIAIISIIIFLFFIMKNKKTIIFKYNNLKINKEICYFILIVIIGVVCLQLSQYMSAIVSFFGLSEYAGYLSGTYVFTINQIITRAPIILLILFNFRNIKYINNIYFFIATLIFDLFISQLSTLTNFSSRMSIYFFAILIIIFLPMFYVKQKNAYKKILNVSVMIFYGVIYWWYYYYIFDASGTVPYIFRAI